MAVGILHPGEMGAAVGAALFSRGHDVYWISTGRGPQTRERASVAGLVEVRTIAELVEAVSVILSICPPAAALDVADQFMHFDGIFVDANAIAPEKAAAIGKRMRRFVDGSIIGPPPTAGAKTNLHLAGGVDASTVAELFAGTDIDARVMSSEIGAASALKMAFAGWTKGSQALLLTVQSAARLAGVEDALLDQWQRSDSQLFEQVQRANRSATAKGWRWSGEMDEISDFLSALELPDGFHRAAAETYRQFPRPQAPQVPQAP